MTNPELLEKIYREFEGRFYELSQYCLKETIVLNYPTGKIILEYN